MNDFLSILPTVISLATAVLATILGFYVSRRTIIGLGVFGLTISIISNVVIWNKNLTSFNGSWSTNNYSLSFSIILLIGSILALLTARLEKAEYFTLLLYATTGTLILSCSRDLIVSLIGFEAMSLSIYVLAGFNQTRRGEEGAMKYFLLGALSSALLIYGIAFVFGATGSFKFDLIHQAIANPTFANTPILAVGAILILIGFAFKIGFVPFHQWAPDVYSAASTPITQYMSVVIKTAAFAGLFNIISVLPTGIWQTSVEIIVASTLIVGNLLALRQKNLKRMLAYSSIAHAGYLGLALVSGSNGFSSVIYYLLIYTLMNSGAFAILDKLSTDDNGLAIDDLAGIAKKHPYLSAAFTVFLLSLAGIPPLAGFIGKYLVFSAALQSGHYSLVVVAAICSAISLFYYLRPVVLIYFKDHKDRTQLKTGVSASVVLAISAIITTILGFIPNLFGLI